MASGFGVNLGKTKFIEDYLEEHRGARLGEINEAWKDAGHEGTVSESLVGKVRGKIKQRELEQGDDESDEAEDLDDTPDDSYRPSGTPSKSSFVVDMLENDPSSNVRAVNNAWAEAGYEGTISDPIFYKVKKRLMLADGVKYQKGRPGRPPLLRSGQPSQANLRQKPLRTGPAAPGPMVDEVEAGIDDLMFRLKSSGGMPEVEAALRSARRLLVQGR